MVPIAVAGTGLALFIVGGLVYLDGAKKVKDYESPEKCGPTHKQCPSDMVDAANSAAKQETTGGVIALVGLPVWRRHRLVLRGELLREERTRDAGGGDRASRAFRSTASSRALGDGNPPDAPSSMLRRGRRQRLRLGGGSSGASSGSAGSSVVAGFGGGPMSPGNVVADRL